MSMFPADSPSPDHSQPPEQEQAPVTPSPINYVIDKKPTKPISEIDPNKESIYLPSDDGERINERFGSVSENVKDFRSDWIKAVQQSILKISYGGMLRTTAQRSDAEYRQRIDSSIGALHMGPARAMVAPNQNTSTDTLKLMIRQELNLGSTMNVPLWHSGFWIRIKAPTEGALLELYRSITQEEVSLGRSTYGLLFSNTSSYTSAAMMNFIADHVISTSLQLPADAVLSKYISVLDIPTLIWGAACAIWSNGFQYERPCTADPEKCNHVIKEHIDPTLMYFVDKTKLTARQISHMTKRDKGSVTVESLQIYKDDFLDSQPRLVKVTDNLSLILGNDSVLEHIESGNRWISSIESTYTNALLKDPADRDEYILRQAKTTVLRQYSHFVKSIRYHDVEYSDRKRIEEIISELSESDEIRELYEAEIRKFIEESTIVVIGVENFQCPSCNKYQTPPRDGKPLTELIPIDVMDTFFTLVVLRIQRIDKR